MYLRGCRSEPRISRTKPRPLNVRRRKKAAKQIFQTQREIQKANDLLGAEERRADKIRDEQKELEGKLRGLEKCAKVNALQILERQQHIQAKTLELHQHCVGSEKVEEEDEDMADDSEDPIAMQIAANEELMAAMQAQAAEMRQQYEEHVKTMFVEFKKQIDAGRSVAAAPPIPEILDCKPSAEAQDKVQRAQEKVDATIKKAKDDKDKNSVKKTGKDAKKNAGAATKVATACGAVKNHVKG